MTIEPEARRQLLTLARRSITEGIGQFRPPADPDLADLSPVLRQPAASFVTLKRAGRLRGCRGMLEPVRPLGIDVWHNAWSSAFDDPRFPPLAAEDLDDLQIELSVLSPLESVEAQSELGLLEQLEPGIDGLVLAFGAKRATFLPQVWESLPEPRQFLAELKAKAGLPAEFWSPQMQAWRYRVEKIV